MDMKGEYRIPVPREQVWAALNDPEVLRASIPGCESLEKTADNAYRATVAAKVGPVRAKFNGEVTLSDIDPPNGYTISGEGKGGAAGFARGGAQVHLADDGADTLLTYEAQANVGGKLAQIGSRLIDATAKKLADEFFAKFSIEAARAAPAAIPAAEASPPVVEETPPPPPVAPPQAPEPAPGPERTEVAADMPMRGMAIKVPEAAPEAMEAGREEIEAARRAPPAGEAPPGAGYPQRQPPRAIPTWAWVAGLIVLIVVVLLILTD